MGVIFLSEKGKQGNGIKPINITYVLILLFTNIQIILFQQASIAYINNTFSLINLGKKFTERNKFENKNAGWYFLCVFLMNHANYNKKHGNSQGR